MPHSVATPSGALIKEVRVAVDSPLEGEGFEPSVLRQKDSAFETYPKAVHRTFGPWYVGMMKDATGSYSGGLYGLALLSLIAAFVCAFFLHIPNPTRSVGTLTVGASANRRSDLLKKIRDRCSIGVDTIATPADQPPFIVARPISAFRPQHTLAGSRLQKGSSQSGAATVRQTRRPKEKGFKQRSLSRNESVSTAEREVPQKRTGQSRKRRLSCGGLMVRISNTLVAMTTSRRRFSKARPSIVSKSPLL
jgi:hypothetical protein